MSNRRFIVFFLVGSAVLSGALAFLSWRGRVVASLVTRNTLCTLPAAAVDALELSGGDGSNVVALARGEDGAWRLTAPYAAAADPAAVARVLDVATSLPVGDMRTADELAELHEDFADFGLAGNARRVLTLRAPGDRAARIRFGLPTASGREVYARTEGLRNVFTLSAEAVEALPRDADGFRRRALVDCPPEEIVGIDLRVPDSPYVKLARSPAGWRLAAPADAPADGAAVDALVAALVRARIDAFVLPSAERPASVADGDALKPSALVPYGLSAEVGQAVTVRTQAGGAEQIVFGGPAGTNRVYALVQGGSAVVALDRAVADLCRAGGASFRDTRAFPLGKDERIRSLSLTTEGAQVYVLLHSNGVWRLAAPVDAAADPEKAAEVVECVLRLRQGDVREKAPEGGAVRVALSTTARVLPGVLVPKEVFASCGSFEDLRSKTLFELDPAAVRRISLKTGEGAAAVVARDPERGVWRVDAASGGAPATVSQEAVGRLLTALARVEAVGLETVAATPADYRRCGLEAPSAVLAVDFAGAEASRRNILLGGAAPGGGRYATVGGADAIFILSRAAVQGLTAPITE